jgi:hypothetical protein
MWMTTTGVWYSYGNAFPVVGWWMHRTTRLWYFFG